MLGLKPSTAERIRKILDRSPGSEQSYGTGRWKGLRPVLVRCTSATAADTSGVGAQCYPGAIVDLEPSGTTQSTLAAGTVWLTLYGAGMVAKTPISGNVYSCLLLGDVEADVGDTRPRAVAVLGAASTSSDCSGIVGTIRAGSCMSMSIVEVVGACDCIDASQTASLTYDADEAALTSEDLLYGCPPGVLTTICADDGLNTGAPDKWNIVVAGFGAPNTNLNQSYTLTHTTGEIWVGVKNGVTVTATRTLSGWTLSIDDGAVTVTYDTAEAFCCADLTFDLDDDDGTTTAPATLDMTIATACGNGPSYTARLEKVASDCGLCLKFTWVPTAGSGSRTIPFAQVGCGTDGDGSPYIEFATDDSLICTGDSEECGENRIVVRLTCGCQPLSVCGIDAPSPICLVLQDVDGLDVYFTLLWDCLVEGEYKYAGYQVKYDNVYYQPLWAVLTCPGSIEFKTYTVLVDPECDEPLPGGSPVFTGEATIDWATGTGTGTWEFGILSGTSVITNDPTCIDPNAPPVSWNCIPGTGCVEVFDGSGMYASELDCITGCFSGPGDGGEEEYTCDTAPGSPSSLVVPDGPNAVDSPYAGTWVDNGVNTLRATFTLTNGNVATITLTRTAEGSSLSVNVTNVGSYSTGFGTEFIECAPLLVTLVADYFDATGTTTVS